jgi:hypothetical protein
MNHKLLAIRNVTFDDTKHGEKAIAHALLAILEQLENMQKKEVKDVS